VDELRYSGLNREKIKAVFLGIFCLAFLTLSGTLQAAVMPDYERLSPVTSRLTNPSAVSLDNYANLYVTESVNDRLFKFDQSGNYLSTLSGLARPISVAVDNIDRIYIGNSEKGNVAVYSENFEFLHKLGSGDGEFTKPAAISVASDGRIFVADSEEDMIKIYNPDGSENFSFGGSGREDGKFNFPTSVVIDSNLQELIISDLQVITTAYGDSEGARVQIFDLNGVFKRSFGEFGQGEGLLTKPMGLAVDSESRIYVADSYQNVVQVFDGNGVYLGTVYNLTSPMRTPLDIVFGNRNRLYVANLNGRKVDVYRLINDGDPFIEVNPVIHNYGQIQVGEVSQGQVFTVNNEGTINLDIGTVSLTGTHAFEFSIQAENCSNQSIIPSENCTIEIVFSPASVGVKSAHISLVSNDPYDNPFEVSLSGTGEIQITADNNGPYSGIEGQPITLDATGSTSSGGAVTLYEWDIDNDDIFEYSTNNTTQSHTYVQQGTYTITLRITDENSTSVESTTTASISDSAPAVDFSGTPLNGPKPLAVNFTNSSTGYDQPLSYAWDFDCDGTDDSNEEHPSHTYNSSGAYSIALTVTDADGSISTVTKTNYINAVFSYELNVSIYGNGLVTSQPAGISCNENCTGTFLAGTSVTLQATSPTFESWSGCDSSNNNQCTITMNSDKGITANFFTVTPIKIVWHENKHGNNDIFFKMFKYGASKWTYKRLTFAGSESLNPSIAVDGSNIYVVWQDNRDGNDEIYLKKSADGGDTWTLKRITQTEGDSQQPVIAVNGLNIYVVWQDNSDGDNEIHLKRSADGGETWTRKRLSWTASESMHPAIAVDGSNVYVVWQDIRDSNDEIYLKKSADGGDTWTLKRITRTDGVSQKPKIAVDGSNVYIVWQDNSDGDNEIHLKRSSDGGETWTRKRLSWTASESVNPAIAVDGSTIYVVLQDNKRNNNHEIYLKKSSDGGVTWTLKRITQTSGESLDPAIFVSGQDVSVLFRDDTKGNYDVYLKLSSDAGISWKMKRITWATGIAQHPKISGEN
jgi:PKD repeat protein